jgi:hypothetical protein
MIDSFSSAGVGGRSSSGGTTILHSFSTAAGTVLMDISISFSHGADFCFFFTSPFSA